MKPLFIHLSSGLAILAGAAAFASKAEATDIYVGPGRSYHTLAAGVAVAQANDRILLDAGTYTDDVATINVPLTIQGPAGGATLHVTQPIANHKGILVVNANLTVRNLIFDGAYVTAADGGNGAGIRHQNGTMLVDQCTFSNNQNGILANPNSGSAITVNATAFKNNGSGTGYTHAMYINAVGQLTVTNSTFSGTRVGHDIKSRALHTTVRGSTLDDGVSGTTSYAIDLPNGGVAVLDSLRISQGQATSNPTMVAFGAEGNLNPGSSLSVTNSTFSNTRAGTSIGVNNFTSIPVGISGTTFSGVATPLAGAGSIGSVLLGKPPV